MKFAVPPDPHLICKRGLWFRPQAAGYTDDLGQAGIYPGEVARRYADDEATSIHPLADMAPPLRAAAARYHRGWAMLDAVGQYLDTVAPEPLAVLCWRDKTHGTTGQTPTPMGLSVVQAAALFLNDVHPDRYHWAERCAPPPAAGGAP